MHGELDTSDVFPLVSHSPDSLRLAPVNASAPQSLFHMHHARVRSQSGPLDSSAVFYPDATGVNSHRTRRTTSDTSLLGHAASHHASLPLDDDPQQHLLYPHHQQMQQQLQQVQFQQQQPQQQPLSHPHHPMHVQHLQLQHQALLLRVAYGFPAWSPPPPTPTTAIDAEAFTIMTSNPSSPTHSYIRPPAHGTSTSSHTGIGTGNGTGTLTMATPTVFAMGVHGPDSNLGLPVSSASVHALTHGLSALQLAAPSAPAISTSTSTHPQSNSPTSVSSQRSRLPVFQRLDALPTRSPPQ